MWPASVVRPTTLDVVRTVPLLARVGDVENGADFEVPDFLMEQYEEQATNLSRLRPAPRVAGFRHRSHRPLRRWSHTGQ